MDFNWSEDEDAFRREVADFVQAEMTPELKEGEGGGLWSTPAKRAFAKKLAQRGWVGISWPKEYGGRDRPIAYQYILAEELSYAGAPHTGTGVGTIGQTLMRRGTDDQKREILPRIVNADIEFAIGYSEPNAGSDLASLEVRAELRGDEYVVNGQKIWISAAHFADYIWLAARTDQTAPKHKGISLFLFPMDTPGITVTPIQKIGDMRNNVVFFEDVRVPRSALVGEPNRGWYYLAEALDFERIHLFPFGPVKAAGDRLLRLVRTAPETVTRLPYWKVLRHRVAELQIEIEVQHLLSMRVLDVERRAGVANVEASVNKLFGTELQQRIARAAMDVAGLYGQVRRGSPRMLDGQDLATAYEGSLIGTVAGGSNEINRSVIATRGLGLPRG
ncbi:MAG: acyl-CoA dehydrogenase family protein [Chloroflexi bacterium]|nr:acyl-CoA dehydrogenase family protein [Chloroflexota bacterium]